MITFEIEELVGRKITKAEINSGHNDVRLETEKGALFLSWNGDCCSKCYLYHIEGSENLKDAEILEAEDMTFSEKTEPDEEHWYDNVIESMGTRFKTTKGYVTFESRLEHNGFYGGRVSLTYGHAIDQYTGIRNAENIEEYGEFKDLEDF